MSRSREESTLALSDDGESYNESSLSQIDNARQKRSYQEIVGQEAAAAAAAQETTITMKRQRLMSQDPYAPIRDIETSYLSNGNSNSNCSSTRDNTLRESQNAESVLSDFVNQIQRNSAMESLILEIMSKSTNDMQLQLCGIKLLNVCGGAVSQSTKYLEMLISVMRAHPQCVSLIVESLTTIRNMIRADCNCVYSLKDPNQLICVILNAMKAHYGHHHQRSTTTSKIEMPHIGFDLLRRIASGCPRRRSSMFSKQVTSDILKILVDGMNDACLQQIGLSLLSWIVENENSRDSLFEMGGIQYILETMQRHCHDSLVQCNATATLCWLVHRDTDDHNDNYVEAENHQVPRRTLESTRNDTVTTVMQTVTRFIDNPSVFGNCLCILSCLQPTNEDNSIRSIWDDKDILQLAVDGMKQHRTVSKVQRNCLNLLRLVALRRQENHRILLVELDGGLESILEAMKEHPTDAGIQTQACCVLANVCSTTEIHDMLAQSDDCIESVISCQLNHKGSIRVQQAAICFHDAMSRTVRPENADSIAAFGGAEPMIEMMLLGLGVTQARQDE